MKKGTSDPNGILVLVDVGNTNTVFGIYRGDELVESFRLSTDTERTADEYGSLLLPLFTLRGVPVIYYGDEQGFAGVSDDMGARQDMFASRVASFNSERAIGGRAVRGADHFNTGHVLYRALRDLAALRASQPALRRGRQRSTVPA